ncbi:MAG: hypothetical protein H0V70_17085 [Ktedonobacteraceae bacterium]|nr:hypothetical protein [Ktedonobacteraceae bacterium]
MFCNYCKSARPENEAPCPNCGAPSSLLGQFQGGNQGTGEPVSTAWNASAISFNQQWNNNQIPQFSPSWQQNAGSQPQPIPQQWGMPTQAQQPQSLLPVPYTGNAQEENQQPSMQMIPFQHMVPALPDEQAETVYVPPMYTKPRPIIPRYRIISGMLSVLIVSLFVCGGGAYYAQSNGLLTNVERMVGAVRPANVAASSARNIPDPPQQSAIPGPASNVITAATTTLHMIGNTPREQDTVIPVGTPFYVTFSAKPPKQGNIMVKWYMNGQYYKSTPSQKTIDPKQDPTVNGFVTMTYIIPATGVAELYWVTQGQTPQLAQKLYFSVKNN